jgi:hypothetical protein
VRIQELLSIDRLPAFIGYHSPLGIVLLVRSSNLELVYRHCDDLFDGLTFHHFVALSFVESEKLDNETDASFESQRALPLYSFAQRGVVYAEEARSSSRETFCSVLETMLVDDTINMCKLEVSYLDVPTHFLHCL